MRVPVDGGEQPAAVLGLTRQRENSSDIVRLVVGRRGQAAMRTELILRFDYGSIVPWARPSARPPSAEAPNFGGLIFTPTLAPQRLAR